MAQKTVTPLSNTEISAFCSQMAMILRSGIFAMEGISIMMEDARSTEEYTLLARIDDTYQETGQLHEALREAQVFPAYLIRMVRIGEETGRLEDVMGALALYYEREASVSRMIRSALTYPLVMVFMMLLVILVLITKVMPIFEQIFVQLGSEMTGLAGALLELGNVINRYSVLLLALLLLLAAVFVYLGTTRSGRRQFQKLICSLPFMDALTNQLAVCRFAGGMALTLSSGMSPEECLSLSSQLVTEERFAQKIRCCRTGLEQGQDLHKALSESGVFNGIYARMASIGERTGSLDEVMQNIADACQEEIDQKFTGLLAALEPTLVILLSLIVGVILLSVMLPLMGIMSSL
ncbi:MAG: type II secretion system F family protein [Lachnospiraceae bacterium]